MSHPLYITTDPVKYLTPGQEGARARVAIKHAARERAEREGFDTVTILDYAGELVEEVSTYAEIAAGHHVLGYRVRVKPTAPDLRFDHPQVLAWAEQHGDVTVSTNTGLTILVLYADRLDKLKRDYHFTILTIEIPHGSLLPQCLNFIEKCDCKNPECKSCDGYGYVDKRDYSPVNYSRQRVLRAAGVIE